MRRRYVLYRSASIYAAMLMHATGTDLWEAVCTCMRRSMLVDSDSKKYIEQISSDVFSEARASRAVGGVQTAAKSSSRGEVERRGERVRRHGRAQCAVGVVEGVVARVGDDGCPCGTGPDVHLACASCEGRIANLLAESASIFLLHARAAVCSLVV